MEVGSQSITNSVINSDVSGAKKTYKNVTEYLKSHNVKTKDGSKKDTTHTRIGDIKGNIYGGAYDIPNFDEFMELYYENVVSNKRMEYLTEKQLTTSSAPIAVDIDLRFALDIPERVYTNDHIEDMVDIYLGELKKIFQFNEDAAFPVFIFEKDALNRVKDKNLTKDGIHMIIGLQMEHAGQQILRERVMEPLSNAWGDFPLLNEWSDVLDDGISIGHTNWQLYGSRKPNYEAYKLTQVFNITYDPEDEELITIRGDHNDYLNKENFKQLSVRYPDHPSFIYKTAFLGELDKMNVKSKGSKGTISGNQSTNTIPMPEGSGAREISQLRSREEIETYLQRFLESIPKVDYQLREVYEFTHILPLSYYGEGSYSKWIRVCWALRNTSERLLIVWISFCAKSPTFDCNTIPDLCVDWVNQPNCKESGLSRRSIIFWAKQDNPAGSSIVENNTISHYVDCILNIPSERGMSGEKQSSSSLCTDFDLATTLHHLYKHEYVCTDIKSGIWFQFKGNHWEQIDSGVYLRRSISSVLRKMFENRSTEMLQYMGSLDAQSDKYNAVKTRIVMANDIVRRLGQTSDKKNIMIEARDLFYDPDFYEMLDSNPYLMGCKNGVIDFKNKLFRRGLPEDYITKCTNIKYDELSHKRHKDVIPELLSFMSQLFPNAQLKEYMWEHLSAMLIGMPSLNQTFVNYTGDGQNGKSVLTDLLSQTLGTYKVSAPISIITQGRCKVGGLTPEIVALKGARYVVMQEPESTDIIQSGSMKEIVSAVEPITARAPYMIAPVVFVPQFTLIVCCNHLMGVKTQDHGTWRRIRVANFETLFTDKPVNDDPDKPHQFLIDYDIMSKFSIWRETFLAMLVDRAFKNQGKETDCAAVLAASSEYRDKQDFISAFVSERLMKNAGSILKKSQLTEEFKQWYTANCGDRAPSPKNLHEFIDKKFGRSRNGMWTNVKFVPDTVSFGVSDDSIEDDFGGEIELLEE
jgi:P4 family phage/plasmid primase-like protien